MQHKMFNHKVTFNGYDVRRKYVMDNSIIVLNRNCL